MVMVRPRYRAPGSPVSALLRLGGPVAGRAEIEALLATRLHHLHAGLPSILQLRLQLLALRVGQLQTILVARDVPVDQPLEGLELDETGRVVEVVDDVFRDALSPGRLLGGPV